MEFRCPQCGARLYCYAHGKHPIPNQRLKYYKCMECAGRYKSTEILLGRTRRWTRRTKEIAKPDA